MKPKFRADMWILLILLALALLLPAVVLFFRGDRCGFLYSIPGLVILIISTALLLYSQRNQIRYIAKLNGSCENAELAALQTLPLGFCVVNEAGVVIQYNQSFCTDVMDGEDLFGRSLHDMLLVNLSAAEQDVIWQQRQYHITAVPYEVDGQKLTALFWDDRTELHTLRRDYENSRPCVLLIVVDNYEDLLQNVKESERLEANVAVEKLMERFVSQTNGILRRLKTDKFIAIVEEQHIQQLISGKFGLLDEARKIQVDERNCVTLSIGVGHGGATLQESENFAAQCLDMALGRGGDQAAVRTENGFRFFGGVSKGVEKKSRAKTRIVAGAIQDLIQDSKSVYLMGHRFGDLDSVGGACGLAGAIELMGVPVHVVVDPKNNLSHQLIELVEDEMGSAMFLTPQEAIDSITDETLLIIVDTHNKDIIESKELYQKAKRVVVIDHHRKNVNFVDNAIVFHHEPYASSACEMITELLQYFKLSEPVDSVYADCLLAGITLDTKNFVMRTGVRTFEAAAYLRKIGADTVRVRNLFSGSIEAYRSRTEIVGAAQLYDCYAIAVVPENTPDIRLVAPQAADELLSISGVQAAFVIYEVNHVVNISARSFGAVNVQVIMEQLGGGGHQSMAATQMKDTTSVEAKKKLLSVLND